MDRSGREVTFRNYIFPGWSLPLPLYAPFEKIAENTIIRDAFFFSADAPSRIDEAFSLDTENQCVITAHSMGTLFALKAAAESKNVKALILFSPFAKFTSTENYEAQDIEAVETMKKHLASNPEALLKSFWRRMAKPENFTIEMPEFINTGKLAEGLDILASVDVRNLLPKIEAPTLILQGSSDMISSCAMASYVKDNLPDAQLVTFENSGHSLPFTQTAECMRKIKIFLEGALRK